MARSSPYNNKLFSSPKSSPRNYRESPSRQQELDMERTFTNVRLHDQESQKLYIYHRKAIQDELDAKEYAQAVVHKAGIDDALAKHEIVRQQAVAVLEAHIREEEERRRREEEERRRREEEEKRRREAEQRRRAEEERRAQEERERKAREAREKAEAEKRAAEDRARAEEEEKERRKREVTAKREQEAQEKAEASRKQQQDDAKAAAENGAADKAASIAAAKAAGVSDPGLPWSNNPRVRHQQYLDIHQRLKALRLQFKKAATQDPILKPVVGEMRRNLRTATGQTARYDKAKNKLAAEKITAILLRSKNDYESPAIVLNDYLPSHLSLLDKNTTTVPTFFLYLVSIFSKSLVAAWLGASSLLAADSIGTLAATVFSNPQFQFQRNVPSPNSGLHYDRFGGDQPTPPMTPSSVSLISILLAKLHAEAPILFGIFGSEKTEQGRKLLGWKRSEGQWMGQEAHYNRVTSLSVGYASLSLRNFSKTMPRDNPYPPTHFWESLTAITNIPGNQLQISHILTLKALIDAGYERFILFYGSDAVAVLRQATVEFPKTFPQELAARPEAQMLAMLPDKWAREMNIHLT